MTAAKFYNSLSGPCKIAVTLGTGSILLLSAIALLGNSNRTKVWQPGELPVAFWAWQSAAPDQADVNAVITQAKARTLFLRAGQIDFHAGKLRRIRALTGEMPRNVELHLVYNATRSCLAEFENVNQEELAGNIAEAYGVDMNRALAGGVTLDGVQLDFDIPTRLLASYARLLKSLSERLPADSMLSITGLPTWMDSPSLGEVLLHTDFWIPQCYGASIPGRLDRKKPISSPRVVASAVARARELKHRFYAGLSAYGYALHYCRTGSLLTLRGDLNPAVVANARELELVERETFSHAMQSPEVAGSGEWRYVYRARSHCVVDGTPMRAGDWLVLDMPSAASLRACARAAREEGGAYLAGLCVFRMPSHEDPTTLTAAEVACALADQQPRSSFAVQAIEHPDGRALSVEVANDGSARARMAEGAITLLLRFPRASIQSVSIYAFASYEPLAETSEPLGGKRGGELQPSSPKRADALRLNRRSWRPGDRATAKIAFDDKPPASLQVEYTIMTDDGRKLTETRTVTVMARGGN